MNKNSLTNKFVNEILDLILNETNKVIFQHEKMKKIREINKNAKMSTLEKQKLISQIMLSQYQEEIKEEELTINIECKHYQRNCLILAECCQKFYPCRICHDEKEDHKINRYLTKKMKCKLCNEIQDVSNECITCNEKMGDYYCDICHLWINSEEEINIFHCKECNMCRMGKREDFIHCNRCNGCINKNIYENHACNINGMKSLCPICQEDIHSSRRNVYIIKKCNHILHMDCAVDYLNSRKFRCPICKITMIEDPSSLWESIKYMVESQPMPEQYKNYKCVIHCNDCLKDTETNYHFLAMQCKECESWNTTQEEVITND
jgi:RING finger/CHY zinc finger protein 1